MVLPPFEFWFLIAVYKGLGFSLVFWLNVSLCLILFGNSLRKR